jgi:hypothetical protein
MVQHETWDWIIDGFKYDPETQVKPRTVEYYVTLLRLFALWAQNGGQSTVVRRVFSQHASLGVDGSNIKGSCQKGQYRLATDMVNLYHKRQK